MIRTLHPSPQATKTILLFALQAIVVIFTWLPTAVIAFDYGSALSSTNSLALKLKENLCAFVDFTRLYACAQLAKTNAEDIWDPTAEIQTLAKCLQISPDSQSLARQMPMLTPVRYTPQCVALAMPLTVLPLNQALIFFEILALLAAIIPITFLLKKYQNYSTAQIILWWAIVLSMPTFIQNICLGQFETIIAGLSAIFLLTWENNNTLIAPLVLALAIAIKPHHALVMLMMALAARRYRLLLFTILFSALIFICTSLTLGSNVILKYPTVWFAIEKGVANGKLFYPFAYTINLIGTMSMLFNPVVGQMLGSLSTGIFLLATYFIWRRAVHFGRHTYPFTYAVSLLLSLILGPHSNFYALFLLNVAWAITVPIIEISRLRKAQTLLSYSWCMAFLFFPFFSWYIIFAHIFLCAQLHLALLLILLLLALANLIKQWQLDPQSK